MFHRIIDFIRRLRLKAMSPTKRARYMRKRMHYVGTNVWLFTTNFGPEPYLISIHDNCVCAADVTFITHDISVFNVCRYKKIDKKLDKVGSIELFENSFVGAHSILMPNTSVGRNSIVAAGSVVTKRIPDGEVWGGNPAKYIMSIDEYYNKTSELNDRYTWINGKLTKKELKRVRESFFYDDNHFKS